MRVLVACEFSGIVRDAFRARGHDAWSCDLLPTEKDGPHIQGDVLKHLGDYWDLMIAHPPCTYLAVSGARWFKAREQEQRDAIEFVFALMDAPIARIAIENPIGVLSTRIRKPDQIIQPYQFGTGETKATCLWLKNLPLLTPTHIVEGRRGRVHHEPPGPDRWKNRSRTYQGIADAMVDQWGTIRPMSHDSGADRAETAGTGLTGVGPENETESVSAPPSDRQHDGTCGYPSEAHAPSCWCEVERAERKRAAMAELIADTDADPLFPEDDER